MSSGIFNTNALLFISVARFSKIRDRKLYVFLHGLRYDALSVQECQMAGQFINADWKGFETK
jgi:hypothetical protein